MEAPPLAGVFAASLTPLAGDLKPDRDAFIRHGRWLLSRGCDGLGILGTTGEANSLSVDERVALIEAATAELPPEKLLPGTGSCALADAVRLTRAALAGGATSVLVLPPFYYRPLTDDGAFGFFARLVDAVADERLRLYLYNIPQLTGFAFGPALVERLRARFGATIAGMKDSSGHWESMRDLQRRFPDFRVFAGTEQYLLPLLEEGGAGCISATANVTSPLCQEVFALWRRRDGAAEPAQARLTALRQCIQSYPTVPALKGLMERSTGERTWRNVLPPFAPMEGAALDELAVRLEAVGLRV